MSKQEEILHKKWLIPNYFTLSEYPIGWIWLCDEPYYPVMQYTLVWR